MEEVGNYALNKLIHCIDKGDYTLNELSWISSLIESKGKLMEVYQLKETGQEIKDSDIVINMYKNTIKYYSKKLGL